MHPTHPPVYPVVGTPADILRAAAHYIQVHGWTQGEYYFHQADTEPSTWPRACAIGAIGVAVHGHVTDPHDLGLPAAPMFQAAYNALSDYLDVADDYWHDHDEPSVGGWNDQPDQTAQQVISSLNSAANRWDNLSGGAA